jgi:hypothetical protein
MHLGELSPTISSGGSLQYLQVYSMRPEDNKVAPAGRFASTSAKAFPSFKIGKRIWSIDLISTRSLSVGS